MQAWEERNKHERSETKYPNAMPFILCNVFIDRFCSAGVSAILALYFHVKLDLDTNLATSIYHVHEFLMYFFTIIGAVIADSFLGHFKTILVMAFIYAAGALTVSLGNIAPLNLPTLIFTVVGLIPMVIGSGSNRANLSVFGANQYKLPEQASQLSFYFSLQYFVLKCGSVLGRLISPILRQDVKCFGMNDCYPLSFGVIAGVMFTGLIILLCGNSHYVKIKPSGNMLVKVCKCVLKGVCGKFKNKLNENNKEDHWLDYARENFGDKIVDETKTVINILILYLPLPIYWAVYTQQSSRWVFQAKRMDGDIGIYNIKPDQMIILNSFLGVLMIPVCNYIFYPLLARIGLKTPLQKMTIGGVLAGIAFAMSAFMELKIQQTYISVLWLIPQYLILAISEIFLFVSNVKFAYTEAPESMKSVMQAFTFMTIALGNFLVALISGTKIFNSQSTELFFFAGIMFVDMVVFGILASKYKYKKDEL